MIVHRIANPRTPWMQKTVKCPVCGKPAVKDPGVGPDVFDRYLHVIEVGEPFSRDGRAVITAHECTVFQFAKELAKARRKKRRPRCHKSCGLKNYCPKCGYCQNCYSANIGQCPDFTAYQKRQKRAKR